MSSQENVALSQNAISDDSSEGSSSLNYRSIRYFLPFAIVAKAVLGTKDFTFVEFNDFVTTFDVRAENHFCGKSREIAIKVCKGWSANLKDFAQKSEENSQTIAALKTIVLTCNPTYTDHIHGHLEERHFLQIMTNMQNGTAPKGIN